MVSMTSIFARTSLQGIADGAGCGHASDAALEALAADAEARVEHVIREALHFMLAQGRGVMTPQHVNEGLKRIGFVPIYGYDSNAIIEFTKEMTVVDKKELFLSIPVEEYVSGFDCLRAAAETEQRLAGTSSGADGLEETSMDAVGDTRVYPPQSESEVPGSRKREDAAASPVAGAATGAADMVDASCEQDTVHDAGQDVLSFADEEKDPFSFQPVKFVVETRAVCGPSIRGAPADISSCKPYGHRKSKKDLCMWGCISIRCEADGWCG